MMGHYLKGRILFFTAMAAGLLPSAVPAQGQLEEVVVTATRRQTSLQDTGLSITAFSGDQMRQANMTRFDDIGVQTPGLQYTLGSVSPLVGLISIRGVSQNDFAPHLEAPNALYIDDVYRPAVNGNVQSLFDVERVEVIKGPQGTLFGRNATGGLIHIITRDPGDELEGYVELGYAEYDKFTAEGALNMPFSETVKSRVALYHQQHDGWIENAIGPDNPEDDTTAVRAKLLFEPNDDWRVKVQGEWYRTDNVEAGGGFPTGGFVGPDTLGRYRPSGRTDTGYIDADGDVFTGEFNFPGKLDREDYSVIGDIQYRNGNYTFTSITSYSNQELFYSEDNDLTPFDITVFRQSSESESFSQELRANADYERMRLTGGFYYLDIDGDYFQGFQINNLGNFNQIVAPVPVLLIPLGLDQSADYALDTKSWSLFAQGEYDFTPSLTMTVGLRYTDDEKDYSYLNNCTVLAPVPACTFPPTTLAGAGLVTDSHSEDGISARVQFDYAVTDDWLIFLSYNRGYKAFSYNAGFAGAATVSGARFEGEKLDAYEVGTKLDFWNRRARLNVSGYYYDYHDYQAFDQRGVNFILSNTDATVYGADAEFALSLDNGINLQLGLALLDTDVKDIPIGGQLLDREAPQSPDVSFNFLASKDWTFKPGTLQLSFDGVYTAEYFSQLTNAPVTKVGDYWIFNTRLSFTTTNERWEAALYVRNLLDEEHLQYAFDITFPGNGLVEQSYSAPQWIGGTIRYNF